jgi:glyoxylase-like metal-dependent hydrolase (beta-lactamase superfamily II)
MQVGRVGTNCYVVWDEDSKEAFVVDPAAAERKIMRIIDDEKLKPKYIVLTHGHGDHIGGVPMLQEAYPGIQLVAGRKDQELLTDAYLNFSGEILGYDLTLVPDRFLAEGDELEVGNMKLSVIETPGHTDGGICILVGKTLFSGDTLFRLSIGRTDMPNGDYATLVNSIRQKLFVLPDDVTVYPGHMDRTSIGFEKAHNPFV